MQYSNCNYRIYFSHTCIGQDIGYKQACANIQIFNENHPCQYCIPTGSNIRILLKAILLENESRNSSVDIAEGYGLDSPRSMQTFSLLNRVQTDFEAFPTSYRIVTVDSFPAGRAVGA
jgi:hypothetical protein